MLLTEQILSWKTGKRYHSYNDCVLVGLIHRYATQRSLPETDAMQNIYNVSATIINGVTTINFVRDKITNDSDADLNLNVCRFVLFAWGDDVDFNTGVIRYHGLNQRSASNELICFPSAKICPNKCNVQ